MINPLRSRAICLSVVGLVTATLMAIPTTPPGGPEILDTVETTHPNKACVTIPSCPGARGQTGVFGSECGYCMVQWTQKQCGDREPVGTCYEFLYRAGGTSCGVRFVNGTISPNGNCVGAVASGICYRKTCLIELPGV